MPLYYYQALNPSQQPLAGQVEAASLAEAVGQLEAQGLVVQSIGSTPPASAADGENPFAAHEAADPGAIERAVLVEHLSLVMKRGRQIVPALAAYAEELPRGRRRRELQKVIQILQRGDAEEAARTLTTLPGYWIPLLSAASAARDPERVLREFVSESERALELQRQWWLALAYPALIGTVALAILTVLSIFVIPVFRDIFEGFSLKLPNFTVFVLTVAEWIASGRILLVAAAVVVAVGLLRLAVRLMPVSARQWLGDRFGLLWGRSTLLARFAQFTADLLEAELQPPQAVRLAGLATGNATIRRAAQRVARDLEAGRNANPRGGTVLTATVLHALHGAAATARVHLLREVSASYSERARRRLSWTRGVIEPVAIIVIGLVVGAVVLALFLPLISLVQGLS